jgi:hypothetical protein
LRHDVQPLGQIGRYVHHLAGNRSGEIGAGMAGLLEPFLGSVLLARPLKKPSHKIIWA